MAGHRHEGCNKPFLKIRWKHRYWVCDCGREWRYVKGSSSTYNRWHERSKSNQDNDYASKYHYHDEIIPMQSAIRDIRKALDLKKDKK